MGAGQFKRCLSCELCTESDGDNRGREVLIWSPGEKHRVADDGETAQEHGRHGDERIQQPGHPPSHEATGFLPVGLHCYGDGLPLKRPENIRFRRHFRFTLVARVRKSRSWAGIKWTPGHGTFQRPPKLARIISAQA